MVELRGGSMLQLRGGSMLQLVSSMLQFPFQRVWQLLSVELLPLCDHLPTPLSTCKSVQQTQTTSYRTQQLQRSGVDLGA